MQIADELELDLVEISPSANPPVCKVIDYSKFLYQLKNKEKEQKAKNVKVVVKEIRFGPQTDEHDSARLTAKHPMKNQKTPDTPIACARSTDPAQWKENECSFRQRTWCKVPVFDEFPIRFHLASNRK